MLAAFDVLANVNSVDRKIMILGDMKELGSQSEELHKTLLQELNKCNFDMILLNGSEIIKASKIVDCENIHSFENKNELIAFCRKSIKEKDAVLSPIPNRPRSSGSLLSSGSLQPNDIALINSSLVIPNPSSIIEI